MKLLLTALYSAAVSAATLPECGTNYRRIYGDIHGTTTVAGLSDKFNVASCSECAAECDSKSDCKSFECSLTDNECHFNTSAEPNNGQHEDYSFCIKECGVGYHCPAGYRKTCGDTPGYSTINGVGGSNEIVEECDQCAGYCDAAEECQSFECSPDSLFCNLNRGLNAGYGLNHQEQAFCQKIDQVGDRYPTESKTFKVEGEAMNCPLGYDTYVLPPDAQSLKKYVEESLIDAPISYGPKDTCSSDSVKTTSSDYHEVELGQQLQSGDKIRFKAARRSGPETHPRTTIRFRKSGSDLANDTIVMVFELRYWDNTIIWNSRKNGLYNWAAEIRKPLVSGLVEGEEFFVEITLNGDKSGYFTANVNDQETYTFDYRYDPALIDVIDVSEASPVVESNFEITRANGPQKCVCAERHVINGSFEHETLLDHVSEYIPYEYYDQMNGIKGWRKENNEARIVWMDLGFDGKLVFRFWGTHLRNSSRGAIGLQNSIGDEITGATTTLVNLVQGKTYRIRLTAGGRQPSASQSPVFESGLQVLINDAEIGSAVRMGTDGGNLYFFEFTQTGTDGTAKLTIRNSKSRNDSGGDNTLIVNDVMVFETNAPGTATELSECPAVDTISGSFADSCTNCSVGFNTDHCSLTCTCPDDQGVEHVSTVNLQVCATPSNMFGLLMCPGTEGDLQGAQLTQSEKQRILRQQRLICGDANEIKFSRMYRNVSGRYHLDFDDNNEIHFSSKGTSGVNIALMNRAKANNMREEQLTEGYTGAFDIFIGPESEPVAHFAECLGCAPKEVVNLGESPLIKAAEAVDIVLKVDGSEIKIGRKGSDGNITWVFEVSTTDYIGIDEAVFTYGYGDLECKCPVTDPVHFSVYSRSNHSNLKKTIQYDQFVVDLRTMSARVAKKLDAINGEYNTKPFEASGCNPNYGHIKIDMTNTPYQLRAADIPAAAFTTSGFSTGSGSASPMKRNDNNNGVLVNYSAGGGTTLLKCESLQKCELICTGYCGHCAILDSTLAKFSPGSNVFWSDVNGDNDLGFSIAVEYVDNFVDACTGQEGLCEVEAAERVSCDATSRDQCKAKGCCFDEGSLECFEQKSATPTA